MFQGLQYHESNLYFPPGKVRSAIVLTGCGFCKEESPAYRWHGVKRGVHGHALFQYTLSGAGQLRYGKRSFVIGPGQAMIVHFPHDHEYRIADSRKEWEFLYAIVSGSEAVRLWKHLEREAGPVVELSESGPSIEAIASAMREAASGQVSSVFAAARLGSNFAYNLAQELLSPRRSAGKRFEELKSWCKCKLGAGVTVQAMARHVGMSRHHFAREFRQSEGVSPRDFLEWLRIENACRLLRETGMSIKETAHESGYSRPDYFSKAFKKIMRVSPLTFRRARIH
jgi:AraC family transcriptional regulator